MGIKNSIIFFCVFWTIDLLVVALLLSAPPIIVGCQTVHSSLLDPTPQGSEIWNETKNKVLSREAITKSRNPIQTNKQLSNIPTQHSQHFNAENYPASAIEASPVESIFTEELKNATHGNGSLSPIIYLLINLSRTESELLERYLRERNYASLKEMIDHKKEELFQASNKPLESLVDMGDEVQGNFEDDIDEVFLESNGTPLNFTKEQFLYAEAYQNASIYSIIRALWNTKVEQELPQIDQFAILEYYNEKRAEEEAQQNVLIWLWNLIRRLFEKTNEKYECYANEPKCVRAVLDRCSVEELERLQEASDNDDLMLITDLIKSKLDDDLDLYIEYDKWNNANDVPEALKEITHGLSQAQRRAMEKLRRLELTDKIKDFYRDNIEKTSLSKQEEIELFFRRMNKTFARCYNPIIKKPNERYHF